MSQDRDFIVCVSARFTRSDGAPIDFEVALADALMARADVATVRVEFAPDLSVFRLDATGATPGAAEATCRATVERVIGELGAKCHVESVVALDVQHTLAYDMRNA